ncbi:UbiA family prenyltransferase [Bernardetia sp. Wsw4-3y2]|uniref:UbiA family prenyltransferase n=1 Tax=Bernardetia sp. Wsw4-3y2 TaxID=3127471 RepID=UPI0030CBB151
MITRSTLLHLRIPFSIFLMPVFCFAASQAVHLTWQMYLIVFVILHIFVYPASNGFNSFYDKDEGSIGGLKNPPKVNQDLLTTSLIFDIIGLFFSFVFVNWQFALLVFIYGLMSKAYSHPSIRLKKYAIGGWLTVGIFQGACTYLMCVLAFEKDFSMSSDTAFNGFEMFFQERHLFAAALISVLLLGSYPMTQIYQHEEDAKRGDKTISLLLGIRGTFIFTILFFGIATVGFYFYFSMYQYEFYFWLFQAFLAPVLLYFVYWTFLSWKDTEQANFQRTMLLNVLSSLSMIAYFTVITLMG